MSDVPSRLNEMIYHLETMGKAFYHNVGTTIQTVEDVERPCCTFCGHCPEAEAEWLRAIRDELQANAKPREVKASPRLIKSGIIPIKEDLG